MAASVQILCPNGRRQNVKISPNTKMLQVLEEVCKKQGFLPVEQYELKHGRYTVDQTLSFRYTNLPNNAKLELVKSPEIKTTENVTIALQLEDGERLVAEFNPKVSLYQVLQHWQQNENSATDSGRPFLSHVEADKHPVCIYMTEEYVGMEMLKATSLRQLGLTKGRAIIRLIHRTVDTAQLDQISTKVELERKKRQRLDAKAEAYERSFTDITDDTKTIITSPNQQTRMLEGASVRCRHVETNETNCDVTPLPEQQMMVEESSAAIIPRIPSDNARQSRDVTASRDHNVISSVPPLEPFKFPESTKGRDLYSNDSQEDCLSDYKACDRRALVYSLDEPVDVSMEDVDVPDDFFDVTQADLQKMMKDLKEKLKTREDQPLMTSYTRQLLLEERLGKYKHVVIRVQFPDRHVLQAVFKPRETIHHLHQFVKQNLQNKNQKFHLYITPPKTVLRDMSETLIQAQLAPAAVVHVGTEEKNTDGIYLCSDVLKDIASRQVADVIVSSSIIPKPSQNPSADDVEMTSLPSTSTCQKRTNSTAEQKPKPSDGRKMPKWFMTGKK